MNRRPSPSIALDELTRLLVAPIVLVALYLTFRGHNAPGGGFAGGLVASSAWVLRLLAGGPDRLRESLRVPPTAVTGAGLLVAFLAAVAPLLVGEPLLASTVVKLHPPLLGEVKLVSTVVFDLGVAMVVVGVIVSILTYLGAGERDDTGLEHEGRP